MFAVSTVCNLLACLALPCLLFCTFLCVCVCFFPCFLWLLAEKHNIAAVAEFDSKKSMKQDRMKLAVHLFWMVVIIIVGEMVEHATLYLIDTIYIYVLLANSLYHLSVSLHVWLVGTDLIRWS